MASKDPCKKFACKLQKCLKGYYRDLSQYTACYTCCNKLDNVYQPARCEVVIEELRQCCIRHSENSLVCSGIDVSKPYEHNTVDYTKVPLK